MHQIAGIPSLIALQIARAQMPLIEQDAEEVRRCITNNLLLGRLVLEADPNKTGFDSICVALRTCYLVAEANNDESLMRVIAGCEKPMKAIMDREIKTGTLSMLPLERATIMATSERVLTDLDGFNDTDLVLAYSHFKAEQMAARAAQAPKNRAARRKAAKKGRK